MKEIGIGPDSAVWSEIQKELKLKLAGVEEEDAGDDQLMGEAMKMSRNEF